MRQKSGTPAASSEQVVKDVRRAARKHLSTEEKSGGRTLEIKAAPVSHESLSLAITRFFQALDARDHRADFCPQAFRDRDSPYGCAGFARPDD